MAELTDTTGGVPLNKCLNKCSARFETALVTVLEGTEPENVMAEQESRKIAGKWYDAALKACTYDNLSAEYENRSQGKKKRKKFEGVSNSQ